MSEEKKNDWVEWGLYMLLAIVIGILLWEIVTQAKHLVQPGAATATTITGSGDPENEKIDAIAVQPREPKWAADLRAEAEKRGLDFTVWCARDLTDDPERAYFAQAWFPDHRGIYIEDGGTPNWLVTAATQEGAVRKLLSAMKYSPNNIPDHRPHQEETAKRKRQCKSNITGGPGMTAEYANDCKDCGVN